MKRSATAKARRITRSSSRQTASATRRIQPRRACAKDADRKLSFSVATAVEKAIAASASAETCDAPCKSAVRSRRVKIENQTHVDIDADTDTDTDTDKRMTTRQSKRLKLSTTSTLVTPSPLPPSTKHRLKLTKINLGLLKDDIQNESQNQSQNKKKTKEQQTPPHIPKIICPLQLLKKQTQKQNNKSCTSHSCPCPCAFQYNKCDSKSLTEAYLATYDEDYHDSLIEMETQPLPTGTHSAFFSPSSKPSSASTSRPSSPNSPLSSSSESDSSFYNSSNNSLRRSKRLMRKQSSDETSEKAKCTKPKVKKSSPASASSSISSRSSKSIQSSQASSSPQSSSSDNSTVQYTPFATQMNYMDRHEGLSPKQRKVLIDWLIDVVEEMKLQSITLACAVGLVDRCLSLCDFQKERKKKTRRVYMNDYFGYYDEEYYEDSDGNEIDVDDDNADDNASKGFMEGEGIHRKLMIRNNTLQLLGCACMLISSKMNEVKPLKTSKISYLTADTFTEKQIVLMEADVCSTLRFHLHIVTPHHFVHRYLRASHISGNHCQPPPSSSSSLSSSSSSTTPSSSIPITPPPCSFMFETDLTRLMVDYLLEVAMLQYDFVWQKPSLVAASAVYLARATLGIRDGSSPASIHDNDDDDGDCSMDHKLDQGFFSEALSYYTGYEVNDLFDIVKKLHKAHGKSGNKDTEKAVYDKYASNTFKNIALKIPADRTTLFPSRLEGCLSDSDSDNDSDNDSNNGSDDDSNSDAYASDSE